MIEKYRDIRFTAERQKRIDQLVRILADYPNQQLTSRQAYYQFVARGLIENEERSYKLITKLITDARYAGIVDWSQIEDRGREPDLPTEFSDLGEVVAAALNSYRLERWRNQDRIVELWVEKQALAGVLAPIATRLHVTLMVNKGYSSASAMKKAADRLRDDEREPTILYLGDHDPSGEDMVRDIRERLHEFNVDVDVRKVALTMAQIETHAPPPNPAKITDSRAAKYIEKYGEYSWELDALPPDELNRIVTEAIGAVVDLDRMNEIIEQESADRARLREALASLEVAQ